MGLSELTYSHESFLRRCRGRENKSVCSKIIIAKVMQSGYDYPKSVLEVTDLRNQARTEISLLYLDRNTVRPVWREWNAQLYTEKGRFHAVLICPYLSCRGDDSIDAAGGESLCGPWVGVASSAILSSGGGGRDLSFPAVSRKIAVVEVK